MLPVEKGPAPYLIGAGWVAESEQGSQDPEVITEAYRYDLLYKHPKIPRALPFRTACAVQNEWDVTTYAPMKHELIESLPAQRRFFAGLAMRALIARRNKDAWRKEDRQEIAQIAFKMADAMLEESKK